MSTTAQINAKGTKGTGITDEIAKALHDNLGKTITIVAEVRSESRGENLKGDETVKLAIQNLEVIPEDAGAADHVREIAKTAHYNRRVAEEGPDLELDGPAPKVKDVLANGDRYKPHPYLASTLSTDDNAPCDVCGQHEGAPIHADRAALVDPFEASESDAGDGDETGEEPDPDDPSYEPHEFIDDGDGTCVECNQTEDAAVHPAADEPVTT